MMLVFFFNDTATTEIYTLSLHDALPICPGRACGQRRPADNGCHQLRFVPAWGRRRRGTRKGATAMHPKLMTPIDRKSTRLNSSHANISYAVFCLKKKNQTRVLLVRCYLF